MYARKEDVKSGKESDAKHFNCVQRSHQNALETAPVFVPLLFIAGMLHGTAAAAAGALYVVSRHVYAAGYSTGEPKQRSKAGFGYLGLIALLGMSAAFAAKTLGLF